MKLPLTCSNWTILVENLPTFGIHIRESLEEFDFNPNAIAKFQYPETPPRTFVTITLSHSKKDQTNPSICIHLHNEVKAVH